MSRCLRFVLLFCLALLLTLPDTLFGSPYQQLQSRGQDKYWRKLVHYRENLFGGYTSLVDSPDFFFHKEGKYDPEKELEATIDALEDQSTVAGYLKLHPQCIFVERFRFLKNAGLVSAETVSCPDFEKWKKGIDAQSIVLIFSSSFPNNPASIFGHTFIRFKQRNQNDLLDYAASYAAFTEGETEGVIYALKGLFGGYKGVFSLSPYYIKVNEYSNAESRDLYEYELNLPEEGVNRIVNHLWELYSSSYFDYYFINENCSYILSSLIEIGNPDWNLTENSNWYYLPADSIALVTSIPDAVRKIEYRPSLKQKLVVSLSHLKKEESAQFEQFLERQIPLEEIKSIAVLDSLITYWNYRKMEEKADFSRHHRALLREILIHRSKIRTESKELDLSNRIENRPELGHNPSRIALGFGKADRDSVMRLHYKSGLHDLLANNRGMEPYSQIDFLGGSLVYSDRAKRLELSEINWVNVISLQPYTFFDPRISWKVGINYDRVQDIDCQDCFKHDVNLGFGGSFFLTKPELLFYLIPGLYSEFSDHLEDGQRAGPYLEWSLLGSFGEFYKIQITQTYRADALHDMDESYYLKSAVGQTISWGRNWELRASSYMLVNSAAEQYKPEYHELQLAYYF